MDVQIHFIVYLKKILKTIEYLKIFDPKFQILNDLKSFEKKPRVTESKP